MALLTRRKQQSRKQMIENVESNFSALRKDDSVSTKSKPGPGRKGLPGYKKNMGLRLDGETFDIIRRTQQEYMFANDSDVVRALLRIARWWLDGNPEYNPHNPVGE